MGQIGYRRAADQGLWNAQDDRVENLENYGLTRGGSTRTATAPANWAGGYNAGSMSAGTGLLNVTHGLAGTPTSVEITAATPTSYSSVPTFSVVVVTSSYFTVQCYYATSGSLVKYTGGSAMPFYWQAAL